MDFECLLKRSFSGKSSLFLLRLVLYSEISGLYQFTAYTHTTNRDCSVFVSLMGNPTEARATPPASINHDSPKSPECNCFYTGICLLEVTLQNLRYEHSIKLSICHSKPHSPKLWTTSACQIQPVCLTLSSLLTRLQCPARVLHPKIR